MFRSGLVAKLVLGAFVLNAPLCPCAALAADLESKPQAAAEPAAHAGHAQHHAMPDQDAADHGRNDSAADCHGATVEKGDCAMASAEDADAELAKSDRYSKSFAALIDAAPALHAASTIAIDTRPPGPDATRLPLNTPITSHDRLLT